MAMNIGDAVLKFVGDTTQLDAAFQQIEEGSAAKLAPVAANAEAVSAALDGVAQSAQAAGTAMQVAGAEGTQAASTLSEAQTNVARLTYENQVAQRALQQALRQVHATSGEVTTVIESLGQAQVRAAQTAEALALAQQEVKLSAGGMATAMTEAGTVTEFSMHQAKAEIALLGEEIGVKVPRHLRGFLADLPGVGMALSAAFAVTAVVMLVQILGEGISKLREWYEALSTLSAEQQKVMSEAAKGADEQLKISERHVNATYALKIAEAESAGDAVKANNLRIEQAHLLTGAHAGVVAKLEQQVGVAQKALDIAKEQSKQDQAKINAPEGESVDADRMQSGALAGYDGFALKMQAKVIENGEKLVDAQQKGLDAANDALTVAKAHAVNVESKHGADAVKITVDTGEAKLAAQKRVTDAEADLWAATGKVLRAQFQISAAQEVKMANDASEAKYNAALHYQQELLALEERDPSKNAARIISTNATIETLEKEHQVKQVKAATDAYNAVAAAKRANVEVLESLSKKTPSFIPVEQVALELTSAQKLENAFKSLGMTSSKMYEAMAKDAAAAYMRVAEAAKNGTDSELNALVAKKHSLEAQIAVEALWGRSTVQLRKDLKDTNTEIDKGTGATEKYRKADQSVIGILGEMHKKLIEQHGDLTNNQKIFNAIAGDMSNVFGSAVTAFTSGQESMGAALEKALAQYLANLAGKAAADALYFAAWGIADTFWFPARAGPDFAAAGEFAVLAAIAGGAAYGMSGSSSSSSSGGSSGSTSSTSTGPGVTGSSTSAGTNPVQGPTVQHFAAGGLISKPTLAVIGDSISGAASGAREGILPLDDPQAMKAIAAAIAEHMGGSGGGGTTHNWYIDGIISDDKMDKVIDKMNTRVQGGKHLLATEARRTVRRS